jgi:glutamyl-tRNA synthetase
MTKRVSRLAPSPTGALHLGNARTFLINWAIARNEGWTLLMRIEDLDGPRIKAGAADSVLETLGWLGINYDGPVVVQSHDLTPYREAMRTLADRRLTYSCRLTRAEIEAAATAPHKGEHELRAGPELRPRDEVMRAFRDEDTNYRLLVEDEDVRILDHVLGAHDINPFRDVGDFVIWTKRCTPAYQLAVVVDDARQGVTDVVRGADLLPSAARQELIYRGLDLQPPRWWHLPLVLGPDGKRLAKRHGDTRIDTFREAGVPPERIIGLLAFWSGILDVRVEMSAEDFRNRFDVNKLERSPITYMEADRQWLLARS